MSPVFIARVQVWVACALFACFGVWLAQRNGSLDAGYWIDEAIAVGIASYDFTDIPSALRQDGSPPLYYLLLHQWMAIAGSDEAATRSLSLVFAVLSVPAALWGATAIAGRRAGLLAAAGAACCPFVTFQAHETRMYSLVVLLSLIASAAFVLAFLRGRRSHLVTLGVSCVLLLYTHSWGTFLVAGMAVAWLWLWRSGRVGWRDGALVGAAVAVLFAPWLPTLVFQALHTGAPWSERPSPLVLGAVVAAVVAVVRLRSDSDQPIRLLLMIAGVALALAWISSQAQPAWAIRYLAVLSGPLLLAGACALVGDRRRIGVTVVVAAVVLLLVGPQPEKSNARAVAGSMAIDVRPGDLVISTQPEQVPVLHRYLPPGVRYLTPLGVPADPRLLDWRDALPQLRAGRASRMLVPRLRELVPGRRVLLVTPVPRQTQSTAPWLRSVWARTYEWRAVVRSDPRLRRLGATSRVDPGRFRAPVRAELFEVRP